MAEKNEPAKSARIQNEAAISAEGLYKAFGKINALDGIDLAVPPGTVMGLLGPMGQARPHWFVSLRLCWPLTSGELGWWVMTLSGMLQRCAP